MPDVREIIKNGDIAAARSLSDENMKQILDYADNGMEIGREDAALILSKDMQANMLLPIQDDEDDAAENTVAVASIAMALMKKPELFKPIRDWFENLPRK